MDTLQNMMPRNRFDIFSAEFWPSLYEGMSVLYEPVARELETIPTGSVVENPDEYFENMRKRAAIESRFFTGGSRYHSDGDYMTRIVGRHVSDYLREQRVVSGEQKASLMTALPNWYRGVPEVAEEMARALLERRFEALEELAVDQNRCGTDRALGELCEGYRAMHMFGIRGRASKEERSANLRQLRRLGALESARAYLDVRRLDPVFLFGDRFCDASGQVDTVPRMLERARRDLQRLG